jgi:hypothetical protein
MCWSGGAFRPILGAWLDGSVGLAYGQERVEPHSPLAAWNVLFLLVFQTSKLPGIWEGESNLQRNPYVVEEIFPFPKCQQWKYYG